MSIEGKLRLPVQCQSRLEYIIKFVWTDLLFTNDTLAEWKQCSPLNYEDGVLIVTHYVGIDVSSILKQGVVDWLKRKRSN